MAGPPRLKSRHRLIAMATPNGARPGKKSWSASDKAAWEKILKMRAAGWSIKQMTTGTRLKQSRILRLLARYRAENAK